MTVTPLGRDQDCSLKNREPDVPAPWFLDPGGWSKTAVVRLYFIFPGICTLSLEFKNFFACMMNDIILEIYDLPKSYLACTLLAFTLIIHTAFKYWLTNKKKDESLLGLMHKKILSLESANQDLQNRLLNLESANLMQELQSINNKCIAKIGFVDNKYEYLMDRTITLQSDVVTTQTLCKEERLSLIDKIRSLESCVSEEHNRWYDSMKNLESQAREEVHSLEQTLCARLQALEEILCKHDKEPNKQKGKTIKVVTSPNGCNPMVYPVIIHERPADETHPEPYVTHRLQPISIRDFKNMKEAIVTDGIHSTYVKQMLNSWSTSNRIIPDDWHQLTSAVLEYSQQLQWKSWLREEARNLEQQGKLRGFEISQDQILGEGHFANRNIQATYDEHRISLCRTAALNAWEKIPEPGKQIEQGPLPWTAIGRHPLQNGPWCAGKSSPVVYGKAQIQGAICVFPQDGETPVWVPECCVRTVDAPPDGDSCGESPIVDARKDQ
ncbi:hypothetical protein STEG23_005682 [Scotinomys teguina]